MPQATPSPGQGGSLEGGGKAVSLQELREGRRQERRKLHRLRLDERGPGPGHGPPPPPPPEHRGPPLPQDPEARRAERERLKGEVADLRLRLEEAGSMEAGRRHPSWWDLPSRRNQGMRLRHLRHLRRELDWRLDRLEQLREAEAPSQRPARKGQDQ